MRCMIGWVNCNDTPTHHDKPAIAVLVYTTPEGLVKRYPICSEHLQTLHRRVMHHDIHCKHLSLYADQYNIIYFEDRQ